MMIYGSIDDSIFPIVSTTSIFITSTIIATIITALNITGGGMNETTQIIERLIQCLHNLPHIHGSGVMLLPYTAVGYPSEATKISKVLSRNLFEMFLARCVARRRIDFDHLHHAILIETF